MTAAQVQGFGLLLSMALAWGLNWPVMKALMAEWPVYWFRVFSLLGATALLLAVAAAQRDRLLPSRAEWPRIGIASILNVVSWTAVAPLSLFWLQASEAAILAYTMPIWANVLAWPLLGERPGWSRIAGLLLGLAGVALLLAGTLLDVAGGALADKLPGVAAVLCTALMFACGAIYTKRFPILMPPVPLVAWQLFLGLGPVLLIALAFEPPDFHRVTGFGWFCLAYSAAIAQCVAYLSWFGALRRLPAGTATIGALLVPVIGVVSSGMALGEPLGARHFVALALTLSGVVLASRS